MTDALDEHDLRQVGPYRLLGRLGAGGMGQVFLGEDPMGRQAAVKIVHPGFAHDPRFRARFAREVAAGRRVRGPWIAQLLDADPDATPPWLATEYIPGPPLDQLVRDLGPIPAEAMGRLALGLARALTTIHEAGLLHRDIKPSNVLLNGDGPRLIDFGIARAVDGTRMTSTGAVIGTPAFMSPEQAAGEELGPASDVFSLGGVLVFAATGTGPFGTATPLVLLRRVLNDAPDLGALEGPLREVAAACLRRDPAARPTPAQLVERLEPAARQRPGWLPASATTVVTDAPTSAVPAPAPAAQAPRRVSRRVLLGASALAGIGAAAGLLTRWTSPAPVVRWTFPAGSAVRGVAVGTDAVFALTDDGVVTALDAATGRSSWSYQGSGSASLRAAGSVVVVGHTVVDARTGSALGDLDGLLYTAPPLQAARADVVVGYVQDPQARTQHISAFDPVSRAPRWRSPSLGLTTCGEGDVVLADDVALLISCDGVDLAYDLITGTQLWNWPASDQLRGAAASPTTFYRTQFDRSGGDPSYAGSTTTTGSITVEAVDARTGTPRWRTELNGQERGITAFAGQLYVHDISHMYAYDGTTGAPRWTWRHPTSWLLHSIAGSDDQLVAVGNTYRSDDPSFHTASVVSIDPNSGSTRWQTTLPEKLSDESGNTLLTLHEDSVIAAVGSTVYAITEAR